MTKPGTAKQGMTKLWLGLRLWFGLWIRVRVMVRVSVNVNVNPNPNPSFDVPGFVVPSSDM